MQERVISTSERLQQDLRDIEDIAEGGAYTKQFFIVARQAHVRATQSFGTPALIWHVAFWPTRANDPQNLHCAKAGPATREAAREEYVALRGKLAEDLDTNVLARLQRRGRVNGKVETFGKPREPADWEPAETRCEQPLGVFATESLGFTIWWSDNERSACPDAPPEEDLRVRVQADIHPDFATVTFIIDAGRPWNGKPRTVGDEAGPLPGRRRQKIFAAAETVRRLADARLAADPTGAQDLVPETGVSAEEARDLLAASNYLYRDIWDDLCESFDCRLTEFAGATDKVFANFRGVVLSTPARRAEGGRSHLSRFTFAHTTSRRLDDPHPNAVVKSYWPFVRRSRSEADHRDWIACGVFDWRALYITALGGQSEFDPGDEARVGAMPPELAADLQRLNAETKWTSDVPGGFLPKRTVATGSAADALNRLDMLQKEHGADPAVAQRIARLKKSLSETPRVPITSEGDLPRPFHYLILTSGEPHPRQAGRIVDRINQLGAVRLYAMKSFSIIRDADVHLRIYGQLLDQIMSGATRDIGKTQRAWWTRELRRAGERLREIWDLSTDLPNDCRAELQAAYSACMGELERETGMLCEAEGRQGELLLSEAPLMHYRRLLDDIAAAAPAESPLFAVARRYLDEARKAKSRHDEELGQLNHQTDLNLTRIKTYIDELGRDAIGGLPFRINRARYYADLYRRMVKTLRVGSIDTWWDYEQLASRGVDPPLRFIEDVGARLEKLRMRLRDAMEAVQTSAIANQTEATRDNTYQLEVIADEMRRVVVGVGSLIAKTEALRSQNAALENEIRLVQRSAAQWERVTGVVRFLNAVLWLFAAGGALWIAQLLGLDAAARRALGWIVNTVGLPGG